MRLVSKVHIVEKARCFSAKAGSGVSGKWRMSDGTLVPYSSTIERRFVEICDWANEVAVLRWEPFRLRFYDHVVGRFRHYTPDYLVELNTRDRGQFRYLIEVKQHLHYMKRFRGDIDGFANRALIAASAHARDQMDCDFAVITERWVESRGVKNIRLISHATQLETINAIQEFMVSEILTNCGATLGQLVNIGVQRGYGKADVIGQALKLCGCDEVHFDIRHPLSDGSRFHAGPREKVFKI